MKPEEAYLLLKQLLIVMTHLARGETEAALGVVNELFLQHMAYLGSDYANSEWYKDLQTKLYNVTQSPKGKGVTH
jgi:hypothetical protein